MYQLPDVQQEEIILAVEVDAVLFPAGWKVHLYTNNLTPTKANVVGDFTELTAVAVPGYLALAGAWAGAPVRKQDGSWEDGGVGPLQFKATAPPPAPQIVYGWYAANAAGTVLIGSGKFATPFTFTLNGDGFDLELKMNLLQNADGNYVLTLDMEQE